MRIKHDVMKYDIEIDSYIGYPISASYIKSCLAKHKSGKCVVKINSFGGSVRDALDIRQQFIDHGDVEVYIYGMTASAATIIAMGAKTIRMSKFAVMLLHRCSRWVDTWGQMNAEDIEQTIKELSDTKDSLEKLDNLAANLYSLRSGKSVKDMAEVMHEAKWLTAEDCKKFGLVDEIIEDGGVIEVTSALRHQMTACGLPDYTSAPDKAEEKNTLLDSFINAIRDILGKKDSPNTNTKQTINMNKEFTFVNTVLNKEGVDDSDGKVTLSVDELKTINTELSNLSAEKKTLQDQVKNLKSGDGASTHDAEVGADEVDDIEEVNSFAKTFEDYI